LAGFPRSKAISAATTARVGSNAFFGVYSSKWTTLLLMRMLFCGQKLLVWMGGWIFRKYSHLSPQLKLGLVLVLSLAISIQGQIGAGNE